MSHAFQRGQIRRRNVYTHSSATALSLTEEQSGSLIFLDCSSRNLVVNLPPIAGSAGLNYEFLISNSLAGKEIKIQACKKTRPVVSPTTLEAKLKIIPANANSDANNVVTFLVHGTAQIGDKFEVISDGNIDGEDNSLNAFWYLNVLQASSTDASLGSS